MKYKLPKGGGQSREALRMFDRFFPLFITPTVLSPHKYVRNITTEDGSRLTDLFLGLL